MFDRFDPYKMSTICSSYGTKKFTMQNRQVQIQLWDTAGQERYRACTLDMPS